MAADDAGARDVRVAAIEFIGTIAETTTAIHERNDAGAAVFEVVTGTCPGGSFATHGHTLRLRVVGAPHAGSARSEGMADSSPDAVATARTRPQPGDRPAPAALRGP